jgi:hypothetical protein
MAGATITVFLASPAFRLGDDDGRAGAARRDAMEPATDQAVARLRTVLRGWFKALGHELCLTALAAANRKQRLRAKSNDRRFGCRLRCTG